MKEEEGRGEKSRNATRGGIDVESHPIFDPTPLLTRRAQAAICLTFQVVGVPPGVPLRPIVSATVFIPSMVSAIS